MTALPPSHLDLLDGPVTATLATVGTGGYPQVTAIWVYREGDLVVTSLWTGRQKYRNLLRHPGTTVFVADPTNPFRTLEVRGDATITDDPDLRTLATLLGHYGSDLDTFAGPKDDRVRVVITPTRAVALG